MKTILKIISIVGLILTLIPSFFVFLDMIDLTTNKHLMFMGTVLWFFTAPFWMNKRSV